MFHKNVNLPPTYLSVEMPSVHVHVACMHTYFRHEITTTPFLHLRYEKTDCALMCSAETPVSSPTYSGCRHGDFEKAFTERWVAARKGGPFMIESHDCI